MTSRSRERLTDTSPVSMSMKKTPLGSWSAPGPVSRKMWFPNFSVEITCRHTHTQTSTTWTIVSSSYLIVTQPPFPEAKNYWINASLRAELSKKDIFFLRICWNTFEQKGLTVPWIVMQIPDSWHLKIYMRRDFDVISSVAKSMACRMRKLASSLITAMTTC